MFSLERKDDVIKMSVCYVRDLANYITSLFMS